MIITQWSKLGQGIDTNFTIWSEFDIN